MNLKIFMMSDRSQTKQKTHCMIPLTYNLQAIENVTESRLMVAWRVLECRWGGGGSSTKKQRDYRQTTFGDEEEMHYFDCGNGSWTCLCVKIYQLVHLKYMQLITCQKYFSKYLYFSKAF